MSSYFNTIRDKIQKRQGVDSSLPDLFDRIRNLRESQGSKGHYDPRLPNQSHRRPIMTQRDEVQKFEQGRIKVLQEERLHIQKKTFTKWMNSFLQKARMEVDDLFVDLADGKKLLKLLEIISGEKLAKPNNGKMRVHKIENVNKSLDFLHTKVRLESIGAEDIVDGNRRLILGLIWTIILRFQIQEIEIDVDEENESSEKKSAKDALLLWAQRKTNGYPGVHVTDFSGSWRSGLAFNALIHAHRPDLFDYNQLNPTKHIDNLNHAFDIANNELGIPKLLDAEDIDTSRPDEKSVITYVASYYHTFARMKNEEKSGRRIAKIINQMVEADKMKVEYEKLTTTLLDWIKMKVAELENRDFPNSLEGIQTLLSEFGYYRTQEKPPKYKERSEIEALFFNINTQLKELRQPAFIPPDGKLVQDIERAWESLEQAEHSREVALRSELRRQERLEQLYYKFQKKGSLRETYLKEMITILSDPKYGSNLTQVDATFKKHEAISADIFAREERFNDLTEMCNELVRENFRNSEAVKVREAKILGQWHELLSLLEKHKVNLNRIGNIINLIREIDTTLTSVNQLKVDLSSVDTGVHLFAVEELLQKHALQELQVTSLGETERRLKRLGEQSVAQSPKEEVILKKKLDELEAAYAQLKDVSARRRAMLEEARNFYQFLQDQEDEEAWLIEKQRICQAGITAKDLRGVLSLQQKHKLLLDEIKNRKNKFDQLSKIGMQLINEKHPRAGEIQQHIENNKKEWDKLEKLANERTKQLQDAAEAYQFYADANEADSWLNEKTQILSSTDLGSDEPSAQALLQRHKDLQGELNAYSGDIQSLNNQAKQLIAAGISNLDLTPETEVPVQVEEITYETKIVPTEVYEEEPVEKVEYKEVIDEKVIPQVKALYPFHDHGLKMNKGEVLILLNKCNADWWCVRKLDGSEGFAPANYIREIEPRIIQIPVKKPHKINTFQKVKKVKMVPQKVPVKVLKPTSQKMTKKVDDSNSVPKRQKNINDTYEKLQEMAAKRHALLEDAIRLFRFYRECDDFEKWIKDKEKLLTTDDPNENVDQAKRKYEKFLTDLSASNKRIDALDAEVQEFEKQNHSQIDKVRNRHRQIHAAWDRLNKLKAEKEKSLEGASSVELFQRTCDEAKDWMLEKMAQLDTAASGQDLKTVQALQRRHHHLERELAPVEEKVNRVNHLAKSVKSAYPHERANVTERENEIKELWYKVQEKAKERRARLEDAVGQQIFTNSSNALLAWVANVKDQLNADTTVRDVATAELLLKNHQDLKQDMKAHEDEFKQITDLGKKLLKTNPNLTAVSEKIDRLEAEKDAIQRGWKEKEHWLQQCLQLQLFNKEADKIDAATSSHQAFLEFNDLGNSYDEVEALIKQHRTLVNTLMAQDDRLGAFNKKADALIADNHYESEGIDNRRKQVLQRRQAVKELANARSQTLDASKNYQEFCAEVHDLKSWLTEKLKTASDESYRDLNNLERKLQKHEAFEREIRANEGQLRTVNKLGQALIAQDSYRKDDVAKTLKELNDEWQKLVGISLDKGRRLRQALAQHNYNSSIDDINNKLLEIETNLSNTNVGTDLRSCRDLLKKHEGVENDLMLCKTRVDDLVEQSNEMTHDDHFDSDAIRNDALASQNKLKALDKPAKKRREALQESLQFYKFGFDLDNELQWIKEHIPLASSTTVGQNLHQAQILHKKHKKLEAEIVGHQPVIDKTLEAGQYLIEQKHPEHKKVEELCATLQSAWDDLNDKANQRAQILELSLKAQQFFFEASEVESWLNEKSGFLASTDFGRDRDAATKLLTKHKALELELETYSSIITEMGRGANALVQSGHPEAKVIQERQATLEHLVRSLQRQGAIRQQRLMESLFRHEYFLESGELDRWISEQMQHATSEDYGQDYEHLLILQAKFDDFKHRFDAGSERFRQCEDLAMKLISNDSPYSSEIEKKQEQLVEAWEKLQAEIKNRDKLLHAAGEIHRFHRDVSDALSRIQEKDAALGTELGRDLNSALALLRRHEAFENELVVLEAQLQILVDDATNLQKHYPNNRNQLQQQQEVVVTAWQGLKERADLRREKLQASVDLQKFLTQVRDLTSWATSLRMAMQAEENVRSAARAQALKVEHQALKVEIEAREKAFTDAANMATAMEQTGHYDAAAAVGRCNALFDERERLHKAWAVKNIHLDQLIDLHFFLREAKQLENISNAQEAALGNTDFGDTIDEVTSHMKKQEAFEKLIASQDERLDLLFQSGDKLISQNHFEKAQIATKLADIQSKRVKVRQLCAQRRQQLDDALLYAEFMRDVADAKNWISEKEKKLESEVKTGEVIVDLQDKIKKLQKHQAFQAEIAANEGRIAEVNHKGSKLISKRHVAAPEIRRQLSELEAAWNNLKYEINLHGKGLEEAQDILEFNNVLDKLEAWIRDKEVMIQANDTGRDYEHCQALQRKLDDVDSDMRVDEERIKSMNGLADKLISQGQPGVRDRRDNFLKKWQQLQGAIEMYREKLAAALEIHSFDRDVADTLQRINEKTVAMESDDFGRDLDDVQSLQRKQEALEREMTAVENKLKDHDHDSYKLMHKYPNSAEHIGIKLDELQKQWANLLNARENRKANLDEAYTRHKFFANKKDLELWVADSIKRMESRPKPTSDAEAEAQLALHDELKVEIDGRQPAFKKLIEFGQALAMNEDPEVLDAVEHLIELESSINEAWNQHKNDLTHEYLVQGFSDQADQLDSWLASKEAFLNNEDIGDNLRAVETLIRKHQDFDVTLNQQLNRIADLEKIGEELLNDKRYNNEPIRKRLNAIIRRKDKLLNSSLARMKTLEESRALHLFIRNIHEVENWLAQKLQVAMDENYREPSNLQTKIQKHGAFEAEILANSSRVQGVIVDGHSLIKEEHFASKDIEARIEDLESDWKHLIEMSNLKKDRLNDAYQALLFNRSLDEFEMWLTEIEQQIQSKDYGKDLHAVNSLLKKHTALENDVQQHTDNCENIHETAEQFGKMEHFMCEELQERANEAIARFTQLQEPIQARRDKLESSLMLHQFTRDVEDELQWLADREPLAASNDLGSTLTAVQSLQKKHQALETELLSREPIVSALVARAANLKRAGHTSSAIIDDKAIAVKSKLTQIRDLASVRKLRLQDALEVQMYYAEADEALTWLMEKKPILVSSEVGKDEESTQSLQRKLEALNCEIVAFEKNIERLSATAISLIDRQHYDGENVAAKQGEIELNFKDIQRLLSERELKLEEALAYFGFIRECNELQEWMTDQQAKAASEDYGTDVEHVELLTQAFETFLASLNNSEQRVQSCIDNGEKLISANSFHTPQIKEKATEVNLQWEDLMELAHARQEALAGAKQVHMFDRTADDTIAWIMEKQAALSMDYFGNDLESIQALVRKHAALETDLLAVKEQVDAVEQEATRLINEFPDAEEHIEVKREDTIASWEDLQQKAQIRKENLQQSEHLQTYFDQYHDLLAWANEMLAKVTSPDLPQDVSGAEVLIERHKELKVEIDARSNIFDQFYTTGHNLIQNGHFMAHDIIEKIRNLQSRMDVLTRTWHARSVIYDQNLDVQLFKHEANQLENWIVVREPNLKDGKVGDSIVHVEDLIRKHEDFEKTIIAQEEKFAALKRMTLVEEAFIQQKEREARERQEERERVERERLEQLKKIEMQRITELRKQEQRERPEEVAVNEERVNGTTPYPDGKDTTTSLTKSNSVAHMFGDRIRGRVQDGNIKRAESMKVGPTKPPKRTPSFTTRRRGSLRKSPERELPPVEIQSFLERKQVLLAGSKKAPNRTWKNTYTVLCGQLLCFFKNREDFMLSKALCPPIGIHNSSCTIAEDYIKRKYTFRLVNADKSEFLFSCSSNEEMLDWVKKISFRAKLPPSQQLLNLEIPKDTHELDQSSQSSRTSSPDVPDQVVLRHDPQYLNGNSQHQGHRHTLSGESPPPLPMSDPPNNFTGRHRTLDNRREDHGNDSNLRSEWNTPSSSIARPSTMQPTHSDHKKSSRIMDLFRKKRHPSQM